MTEYKINMQKSILLLYISNKQSENKIIYDSIKKNIILRNKVNKGSVGLLHYEQQNIFERN